MLARDSDVLGQTVVRVYQIQCTSVMCTWDGSEITHYDAMASYGIL